VCLKQPVVRDTLQIIALKLSNEIMQCRYVIMRIIRQKYLGPDGGWHLLKMFVHGIRKSAKYFCKFFEIVIIGIFKFSIFFALFM
jgi:hypothetical protein